MPIASGSASLSLEDLESELSNLTNDGATENPIESVVESPESTTPEADQTSEESGGTDESDASLSDWRSILDKVDPKELRKHRRIAGLVGDESSRRAKSLVEKERTAIEEAARIRFESEWQAKHDRELLDENPWQYREIVRQRDEERAQYQQDLASREAEAEVERQRAEQYDQKLYEWFFTMPEEVVASLENKRYPGTREEGRLAFIADVNQAYAEHRLREARKEWDSNAAPALRKEALRTVQTKVPSTSRAEGRQTRFSKAELEAMSIEEFQRQEANIMADLEHK